MTDFDHENTLGDTTRRVIFKPDNHDIEKVRAIIVQTSGPEAPRTFSISENVTVIGRGSTCDIILDSKELSRRHAAITLDEVEIKIEDLNSSNGLFLNGIRIHSAIMRNGDTFQIGGAVFTYKERTL